MFWGCLQFIFKLIINVLLVLGSTEDTANTTSRIIFGLVFGLKCVDCHASEHWRWADLDEVLELVLLKEQVLGFNPAHRGCKLV